MREKKRERGVSKNLTAPKKKLVKLTHPSFMKQKQPHRAFYHLFRPPPHSHQGQGPQGAFFILFFFGSWFRGLRKRETYVSFFSLQRQQQRASLSFLFSSSSSHSFLSYHSSVFSNYIPLPQVHAVKVGKADEAGEASGKKADKMAMKAAADAKAAELEAAAAPKPDFKAAMDKLKAIKAGEKILKKQKGGEADEAVS